MTPPSSPRTSRNSRTPIRTARALTLPLRHSRPRNVISVDATTRTASPGRPQLRSVLMTSWRSPRCGNATVSHRNRECRCPHARAETRRREITKGIRSMSEGYFRTQCRGCDFLVYEGPWIPPRERQLLHEHHRALCTSAPPTSPTTTAPPAVNTVPAPLFLLPTEHRKPRQRTSPSSAKNTLLQRVR